jgi:predicted ester cyclase
MTRQEIDTMLERHQAAFARRDAEALAAGHVPQGSLESPAHGKVTGRANIEQIYRYWLTAFPDLDFRWDPPLVDGDRAALFWRFAGTLAGPFFGDAKPGTRVEMQGAAEYRLAPEGIVSVRHVFDFSGTLLKTGALKVKLT